MDRIPAKISITELREEDRPREKLAALGPQVLTAAELLAILIGSGTPKENAVELMERVLLDYQGQLSLLGRATIDELCAYSGIGPAKAITILAACELGRRRMGEMAEQRQSFESSDSIYHYFLPRMKDLDHEEAHVLLLNNSLRLIGSECISSGGLTGTVVDVRIVLRAALMKKAVCIALCHNHPSGNPRPSRDDDHLTERLGKAAEAVDIRLIDHIVLAEGKYYSYHDENKIL